MDVQSTLGAYLDKAPALSISIVIWILSSDTTLFVSSTNSLQIVRRQCCLQQICKLLMISLADVATARVMSRCSKSTPADSPLLQHWPDVETMEPVCGINWK